MRPTIRTSLLLGALSAAVAAGFVWWHRHSLEAPRTAADVPSYWYDPMHPGVHFDKPGKSPFMEMQLVPKYPDGASLDGGRSQTSVVVLDSRVVQNLGVRLAAVEQTNSARVVDTVGLVGVDEHRIVAIQVRQSGWVERLDVRAVGDSVRRGQLLAGVYSPDLLATQQELLLALDVADSQLTDAARRRLVLFGLSEAQIDRIERAKRAERRVDYYAPLDGYVLELGVRQGAAVQPGTTLFQLADLHSVWIAAEVPETQAAWIKAGDSAEGEIPALPGEHFAARVDYVYPEITQTTRTLKVRLVVDNGDQRLRPGMFVSAHLRGATQHPILTVPSEAVIKTGVRSIVVIADDGAHFHPALVRVGAEHGGRSEILEGLALGQTVVVSGQFLIDSEANLRSAFDNLAGANGSSRSTAEPQLMPAPAVHPSDETP
jgi:membrane fusion protein, copper/silver efflux system